MAQIDYFIQHDKHLELLSEFALANNVSLIGQRFGLNGEIRAIVSGGKRLVKQDDFYSGGYTECLLEASNEVPESRSDFGYFGRHVDTLWAVSIGDQEGSRVGLSTARVVSKKSESGLKKNIRDAIFDQCKGVGLRAGRHLYRGFRYEMSSDLVFVLNVADLDSPVFRPMN